MIDWLFRHLKPVIRVIIHRPISIFILCAVLALTGFLLATNLRIDNDLSKLIPEEYPSVQALNRLREQVGGEHEVAVAIHSPSFEANRKFAETLIPPALTLTGNGRNEPYFVRSEFRKEIDFLKNNALYFATDKELDLLKEYLEIKIEESRMEANPFFFELEEEEIGEADSLGDELNQKYEELVGSEYLISADSTILVVKFFPSGTQTDLQFIDDAYSDLDELIKRLNPSSYHPEMEVVSAGRMIRTLIEVQAITRDVTDSFGKGVLLLMTAVLLYFFYKSYRARYGNRFYFGLMARQAIQIPAHALIMGLPLVFSLCWTFGIAYLVYGDLNIMTSTLGLLLFGMGIDFGIHFYARYAEERQKGNSVDDSVLTTLMTTGQAIFVVGITTAAAFFILMLADFKGFSEFGAIAGLGLLFAILAYIIFLPALMVLLERSPWFSLQADHTGKSNRQNEIEESKIEKSRMTLSLAAVGIALAVTLFSLTGLSKLSFEYDFGKLEPAYEEYRTRNRLVSSVYSDRSTRNAAYIIVDDPTEAPEVATILRNRAESDLQSPTIREVETFQDRFPISPRQENHKLSRLEEIRNLLDDPFLQESDDEDLQRLHQAAATRAPIPLDSVPEFLKNPFTSTSGEIGNLVIVYPSVGLSDGRNSMNFADDVGRVTLSGGKVYYAGSTSIVASDMLRLMISEIPLMLVLTLSIIVVFKLVILRKIRWMVLALLPLAASFLWLFGLMDLMGWKLNFYNLVVLPTILGIGDDSGIHMVHRYLEEGKGSIGRVLHSTGEHITVSILTTMLGFVGLLFSIHPGMRSIAEVAVTGIGLSLAAALFVLPALLRLMEKSRE